MAIERPGENSSSGRIAFQEAASDFLASYGTDLDHSLKHGKTVLIKLGFDRDSRRGLPRQVTNLVNGIYRRRVNIKDITVGWVHLQTLGGEGYLNGISINSSPHSPSQADLIAEGIVISPKREAVMDSEVVIVVPDTDSSLVSYRIRCAPVRGWIKAPGYDSPKLDEIAGGAVRPDVMMSFAEFLRHCAEPSRNITAVQSDEPARAQRISEGIRRAFRHGLPIPASPPSLPHRSIYIGDYQRSDLRHLVTS